MVEGAAGTDVLASERESCGRASGGHAGDTHSAMMPAGGAVRWAPRAEAARACFSLEPERSVGAQSDARSLGTEGRSSACLL